MTIFFVLKIVLVIFFTNTIYYRTLSNGGSLLILQSMLGHTNLNTTTIYLHLSQNFNQLEGIKYV